MSEIQTRSVDSVVDWLVDIIARERRVALDTISPDETFANLGLNSLQILIITEELADFLGVEHLDASLLWDYPTIVKLAEHLIGSGAGVTRR